MEMLYYRQDRLLAQYQQVTRQDYPDRHAHSCPKLQFQE